MLAKICLPLNLGLGYFSRDWEIRKCGSIIVWVALSIDKEVQFQFKNQITWESIGTDRSGLVVINVIAILKDDQSVVDVD